MTAAVNFHKHTNHQGRTWSLVDRARTDSADADIDPPINVDDVEFVDDVEPDCGTKNDVTDDVVETGGVAGGCWRAIGGSWAVGLGVGLTTPDCCCCCCS